MSRRVRGTKSHAAAANERVAGVRRLPSNTGRQQNEHQHREEMPLRPCQNTWKRKAQRPCQMQARTRRSRSHHGWG